METNSTGLTKRKNKDGSVSTLINGVEIMREKHISINDKFIEL